MLQLAEKRDVRASQADPCPDRIEERIIRAYVRLACCPQRFDGARSLTLARSGTLEARLTEFSRADTLSGMPPFWVEIYCYDTDDIIDGCGCHEFDEDELAMSVDLVMGLLRQSPRPC